MLGRNDVGNADAHLAPSGGDRARDRIDRCQVAEGIRRSVLAVVQPVAHDDSRADRQRAKLGGPHQEPFA